MYEWAVYKVPVTQIFLPTSSWSDEVIYSKQLAAAVRYGAPQGYFGFNESHAEVGTYAAWGPAVFFVYALPGLLLRGQNAFLWCNLLFVAAGWTFFALAARLSWKRQAVFALALAAMNAPIRYVFSAMQEPLHYALVLAVLGCGILAGGTGTAPPGAYSAPCAPWRLLCAPMRPCSGSTRWRWPGATVAAPLFALRAGAVSLGGTLVLMSKFYAPYFFTNVDMGALQEAAHGHLLEAAKDMARKLIGAMQTVFAAMASDFANRTGGYYLLLFALLAVVIVCLAVDARRGRPIFWKGCAAVTAVIVFLALMLMYRPGEGSRHTLVLDVLLLASLLVEDARPAGGTALAAAALALLGVVNLADGYTMPHYSAEWDAEVQQVETVLTHYRADSDAPWDNTVAYAFGDPVHCGLLYGVPDGMGIQFDEAAYLTDPNHEIYSRYVMTAADTPTAARLDAEGWQVIYQSEKCMIYMRTM